MENIEETLKGLRLSEGELRVGFGKADITPEFPVPLAGYGSRKGLSEGVHDSVFASALAISNRTETLVFVSADVLIVDDEVADLISKRFKGLRIYFGASHTHSGPGGWARKRLEQIVIGRFDPRCLDLLVNGMGRAISQAIEGLEPARMGFGSTQVPEFIKNRLIEDGEVDPELTVLYAEGIDGKPMAALLIYSAHPTVLGSENMLLSGDYPGYLQRRFEEELGCGAIFMAGAVGSMGPKVKRKGFEAAREMGEQIATKAIEMIKGMSLTSKVKLTSSKVEVHLPPLQFRLTDWLRVFPAVSGFIHDGKTYLQLARVNDLLFIGTPCDLSGEMALGIKSYASRKGLRTVLTSFNGDYIGYVLPDERYELEGYETRTMSFFGPHMGSYMREITEKIIDHHVTLDIPLEKR